jgi:amino acid adenylation domain-containing protein
LPPTNETETALCAIWQDVLGVAQVGIQDNFFALGGHSLKATQLMSRIQQKMGVALPLRDLFNHPTVAELAGQMVATLNSSNQSPMSQAHQAIPRQADAPDYPLSHAQHRLWVLAQIGEGLVAYNMPAALLWEGVLDVEALQTALGGLLARHESLRTSFGLVNGEARQIIAPSLSLPIRQYDLRGAADPLGEARALAIAEAAEPFDLSRAPLCRVTLLRLAEDKQVLLLTLHHIIADGLSEGVLLREFGRLYEGARQNNAVVLPPLPLQYRDYAVWQRGYVASEAGQTALAFWQRKLAGELPVLDLATDFPRPPVKTYHGRVLTHDFRPELSAGLQALSREAGVTLFMTLTALVQTLLYRYTGQTDMLLGTPVHGREHPDLQEQVGFYINTILLRGELDGEQPFTTLLAQQKQAISEAFNHQAYPFDRLVQELNLPRDASRNPLFDVAIVYQNSPPPPLSLPNSTISPFLTDYAGSKFDLSFTFEPTAEGLRLYLIYNDDLFAETRMRRLVNHLTMLVTSVLADSSRPLDKLPILPPAEAAQIGAFLPAPSPSPVTTLKAWFEAQVDKTPNNTAVQYEQSRLTYAELNSRANQLAHALLARGVQRETLVGLLLERSIEMVVAIVAVVKAGGVYVPFDPAVPPERLAFMLADTAATVLITQTHLRADLALPAGVSTLTLEDEEVVGQGGENTAVEISPDQLAYIIYTSGSTGQPKGVMVTHANVTRLFTATDAWFGFNERDVWTLFHSYAFDFSVWEMWGALLYGGRLVVVPYWVSRAPDAFYRLVQTERVTVLNQTPSAFRQIMQVDGQASAELALRYVIFGGEALDLPSLRPWLERHGEDMPQLVNMYGITETTVHVTYRPIKLGDTAVRASLIGRPIPDLSLHILDKTGQPVPIGVPGELYVGGAGVARGYLRRAELTRDRFVEYSVISEQYSVFSEQYSLNTDPLNTGLLYKTGDLACWRADGDIAYLGRLDTQVKIRGFRIELGEIEAVLAGAKGVNTAVVLTREQTHGRQIIAYVVPEAGVTLQPELLRQQVQQRLPEYMVPAAIIPLASLPLTPNGKLDRRALPNPEWRGKGEGVDTAVTELQQTLVTIWQELLGLAPIGIDDNFFDVGGDSLRLIQLHQRLTQELHATLDVVDLFQYPTIRDLAAILQPAPPSTSSTSPSTITQPSPTQTAQARAAQQRAARAQRR